jgi:hypothetical protein
MKTLIIDFNEEKIEIYYTWPKHGDLVINKAIKVKDKTPIEITKDLYEIAYDEVVDSVSN